MRRAADRRPKAPTRYRKTSFGLKRTFQSTDSLTLPALGQEHQPGCVQHVGHEGWRIFVMCAFIQD